MYYPSQSDTLYHHGITFFIAFSAVALAFSFSFLFFFLSFFFSFLILSFISRIIRLHSSVYSSILQTSFTFTLISTIIVSELLFNNNKTIASYFDNNTLSKLSTPQSFNEHLIETQWALQNYSRTQLPSPCLCNL